MCHASKMCPPCHSALSNSCQDLLQEFDISHNQITGTLPEFLSQQTSLATIYLDDNKLRCVIL